MSWKSSYGSGWSQVYRPLVWHARTTDGRTKIPIRWLLKQTASFRDNKTGAFKHCKAFSLCCDGYESWVEYWLKPCYLQYKC